MRYEEFKRSLVEELQEYYGEDAKVTLRAIPKNNGVVCDAILISFSDFDEIASPLQYIDKIYTAYKEGMYTFDECVSEIIQNREDKKCSDEEAKVVVGIIKDWNQAKEYIIPVLVNREKNKSALEELAHREYLDLSVIYMLRFPVENLLKNSTMKITKQLLEGYGITENELFDVAMRNLHKEKYSLVNVKTVIRDMLDEADREVDPLKLDSLIPGEMYVYTNADKKLGAVGILDRDFLKTKSEGKGFYIIPSSIHETIFISTELERDVERLKTIIKEVNDEQLDETEVLSDNLYYYDALTGEISVAA